MLALVVLAALVKLLLFPAYHSTDFDVHRNWLAIVSKLPLQKWYYENTSEWTLDYPPFFAYFEWLLARFVPQSVIADGGLDIVAKGQYGWPTVVFQRSTVLISELALASSLYYFYRSRVPLSDQQKRAAGALIWLSPGWLILDHIHFQYNAMLFGLLIVSITAVANKQYLVCGFTFASLLCFKHLFLYLAPAYFAYLLRAYILANKRINLINALKLGVVVLAPFAVAFGPFIKDIPQVMSRLFPFSRGLTHAYWAPNFWAVYSFAERVIGAIRKNSSQAATRGVVGQIEFVNLPNITPRMTAMLTLFYQVMAIVPVFVRPNFERFLDCVTLCGFASFLFGWHVHEKAIMVVLIPLTISALRNRNYFLVYSMLVVVAYVSLFPLLFTLEETVFKYVYTGVYLVVTLATVPDIVPAVPRKVLLERPVYWYNLTFVLVLPALSVISLIKPRYEFAHLMLLSLYCSLGVLGSWMGLCGIYFTANLVGKSE